MRRPKTPNAAILDSASGSVAALVISASCSDWPNFTKAAEAKMDSGPSSVRATSINRSRTSVAVASPRAVMAAMRTVGIASRKARRKGPDCAARPDFPIASAARARTTTDGSSNPSSRIAVVSGSPNSARAEYAAIRTCSLRSRTWLVIMPSAKGRSSAAS